MLNLVFAVELIDVDSFEERNAISLSSQDSDIDSTTDGLTLSLHSYHQQRSRRLKRILPAFLATESVTISAQETSTVVTSRTKHILLSSELLLKHHRGPPHA